MVSAEPVAGCPTVLRASDGTPLDLPGHRWMERVDAADRLILSRAEGPVIDLGCGPGRHVEALAEDGVAVLGIDISPSALAVARTKNLAVLHRSVFEAVPRAGEWATALLLDGNIGIGGDPLRLLIHTNELLTNGGVALVEIHRRRRLQEVTSVQLEVSGEAGPFFDWIEVDVGTLATLSEPAGFTAEEWLESGGRHFAVLRKQ